MEDMAVRAPSIRAVIFDMGGVLTAPPFGPITTYEQELRLPPGALLSYVRGDSEWARLETGQITGREFWKGLAVRARDELGVDVDLRRLVEMLVAAGRVREDRLDLVRELRPRFGLALLTNATRESRSHWEQEIPAGLFDVIIDSSEVGLRKPDRRIFEHTLTALSVRAHETVFIDDFEENLPQAAALGIHTILFCDLGNCRRELTALGCLV